MKGVWGSMEEEEEEEKSWGLLKLIGSILQPKMKLELAKYRQPQRRGQVRTGLLWPDCM